MADGYDLLARLNGIVPAELIRLLREILDTTSGHDHDGTNAKGASLTGAGVTADAAELNLLDGSTAGTAVASKALALGATKNIDTLLVDVAAPGAAGNTQGNAQAMTADTNLATGADGTKGVKLPTAVAGRRLLVKNTDPTGILKVYPATGAGINGLGANAAISLPPGCLALFLAETATVWWTTAIPDGITATAAEINFALDGITANYQELNTLAGVPMGTPSFVVGAEGGGNTINVAIQIKDGTGADSAQRGAWRAYLSDDANGDSLTATPPSGGCAIGTDGLLIPVTPALADSVLVHGHLAVDAVPEKFKTAQDAAILINGISHVKAATTAIVFSAAHVITASKFGVVLVQINAAGTISTKVPLATQAYDDAPTALGALPAPDAGNVALGYIAIANDAGDWTANTDSLTDDVTSAAFTDTTEAAIGAPKEFELVSEQDGDIDINIVEAGAATWYLVLVRPNGGLVVSGAITFAA